MPRSLPFLKAGRVGVRTSGRIDGPFWPCRWSCPGALALAPEAVLAPKFSRGRRKANPCAVVPSPGDSKAGWAAARVGLGP